MPTPTPTPIPTADSPPFRYLLRVRYAECDGQKVVFNARYGDYVDLATTEFFRALGYGAELLDGRLDYQLVRQLTEWKSPARFDDVLALDVTSPAQGTTSFTLSVAFRRLGESVVLATTETVYVLVDGDLRKRPLPADLRAALIAGATAVVVDHAGTAADKKDAGT